MFSTLHLSWTCLLVATLLHAYGTFTRLSLASHLDRSCHLSWGWAVPARGRDRWQSSQIALLISADSVFRLVCVLQLLDYIMDLSWRDFVTNIVKAVFLQGYVCWECLFYHLADATQPRPFEIFWRCSCCAVISFASSFGNYYGPENQTASPNACFLSTLHDFTISLPSLT